MEVGVCKWDGLRRGPDREAKAETEMRIQRRIFAHAPTGTLVHPSRHRSACARGLVEQLLQVVHTEHQVTAVDVYRRQTHHTHAPLLHLYLQLVTAGSCMCGCSRQVYVYV